MKHVDEDASCREWHQLARAVKCRMSDHATRQLELALRRTALLAAVLAGAASGADDSPQDASAREAITMKIRLRIGDCVHSATLADNAVARDFALLLPLTLTLKDYNATEKVAYLPRELSVDAAPDGHNPSIGDITYYAPWGNLAIFYRDFGYSRGLIHLGSMKLATSLQAPGTVNVTIERVK